MTYVYTSEVVLYGPRNERRYAILEREWGSNRVVRVVFHDAEHAAVHQYLLKYFTS